jgi:hypothetical protein
MALIRMRRQSQGEKYAAAMNAIAAIEDRMIGVI